MASPLRAQGRRAPGRAQGRTRGRAPGGMSRLSRVVEQWLAAELELAPITALLGVRPVALGAGEARIEMTAEERLHNAMGTVHGGVLCDLADVAMGAAVA